MLPFDKKISKKLLYIKIDTFRNLEFYFSFNELYNFEKLT